MFLSLFFPLSPSLSLCLTLLLSLSFFSLSITLSLLFIFPFFFPPFPPFLSLFSLLLSLFIYFLSHCVNFSHFNIILPTFSIKNRHLACNRYAKCRYAECRSILAIHIFVKLTKNFVYANSWPKKFVAIDKFSRDILYSFQEWHFIK